MSGAQFRELAKLSTFRTSLTHFAKGAKMGRTLLSHAFEFDLGFENVMRPVIRRGQQIEELNRVGR